MKQSKKAQLKKEIDKLAKRKYWQPYCLICGKPAQVLHHFIPRSQSLYLRWDKRNLIPICNGCHTRHHRAGDPSIHAIILKKKGWEWYEDLMQDRHTIFKDTLTNLREVRERLNKEE